MQDSDWESTADDDEEERKAGEEEKQGPRKLLPTFANAKPNSCITKGLMSAWGKYLKK